MKPYYQENGITIYNADCREVLPHLDGIDLILTDPPYGVLQETWDRMNKQEFAAFSMSWLSQVRLRSLPLMTFSGEETREIFTGLLESLYDRVRQVIWSKKSSGIADSGFYYTYESIYYCHADDTWETAEPKSLIVGELIKVARTKAGLSRGAVDMVIRGKKTGLCYRWEEGACLPTVEQVTQLEKLLPINGDFHAALTIAYESKAETELKTSAEVKKRAAYSRDVMEFSPPSKPLHPCEKPVGLIRALLNSNARYQTVADLFMGSGSTLRAAKDLGRRAVGIETDERYCEIAAKRLQQEVLQFTDAALTA